MVIAILKSQEGQEHSSLLQLLGQEIINGTSELGED